MHITLYNIGAGRASVITILFVLWLTRVLVHLTIIYQTFFTVTYIKMPSCFVCGRSSNSKNKDLGISFHQ